MFIPDDVSIEGFLGPTIMEVFLAMKRDNIPCCLHRGSLYQLTGKELGIILDNCNPEFLDEFFKDRIPIMQDS